MNKKKKKKRKILLSSDDRSLFSCVLLAYGANQPGIPVVGFIIILSYYVLKYDCGERVHSHVQRVYFSRTDSTERV